MCRGLLGPAVDEVKCIFHSFLFFLCSGGFTVAIFHLLFHLLFSHFLIILLPDCQKGAKK